MRDKIERVIGFLFIVAIIGWLQHADAHTMSRSQCEMFAGNMAVAAQKRDSGVTKIEQYRHLVPMLKGMMDEPGSLVTDEEDLQRVLAVIEVLYDHPEVTPDDVRDDMLRACKGQIK
jgi:hypothetical protein